MLLFLGGILGGLLIAGTVPAWRYVLAEPEVQQKHQGLIALVWGSWFLLAFCVGSWLISWVCVQALTLIARLFGIPS